MGRYAPIEKSEIMACVDQGMTRDKMQEFFGVNRYFMQKELARHGINLKVVSAGKRVCRPKKASELYNPFADDDDDLEEDFDPDSIPLEEIDPKQLTILEQAILKLGDRVRTTSTGYYMDRTPVSVDTIIREAGLV